MARSLLGENKRTETGFDIDSWWYVPWDILAIQMRRKALGLDWVETDDARMHEVWQNREELPFVKDDLVWPTYRGATQAEWLAGLLVKFHACYTFKAKPDGFVRQTSSQESPCSIQSPDPSGW